MNKIASSIDEVMELVNTMLCGGDAYLDWGQVCNTNKNVSCKYYADEVAREFKLKGYFVYYEVMGFGSSRIAQGTPVAIRIKREESSNSSLIEFF